MEAIGQLAGGVAHDFNNLLAAIQMQVDLWKMRKAVFCPTKPSAWTKSRRRPGAAPISPASCSFSAAARVCGPRDLELSDSINNMAKLLRRVLGEHIQMQFQYAPEPLFVPGKHGLLDQVLMNLTLNSRDAMPGGGQLIIATSVVELDELAALQSPQERPGSFARLSVTDTGCGIRSRGPAAHLRAVLYDQRRGQRHRPGPGHGLQHCAAASGLDQCRQPARAGATFNLYFPRLFLKSPPGRWTGQDRARPARWEAAKRSCWWKTTTPCGFRSA